jgi:hypothetical protein
MAAFLRRCWALSLCNTDRRNGSRCVGFCSVCSLVRNLQRWSDSGIVPRQCDAAVKDEGWCCSDSHDWIGWKVTDVQSCAIFLRSLVDIMALACSWWCWDAFWVSSFGHIGPAFMVRTHAHTHTPPNKTLCPYRRGENWWILTSFSLFPPHTNQTAAYIVFRWRMLTACTRACSPNSTDARSYSALGRCFNMVHRLQFGLHLRQEEEAFLDILVDVSIHFLIIREFAFRCTSIL